MSNDNLIKCKLFEKNIDAGLCAEICNVLCHMLARESVPEIEEIPENKIKAACNSCPYSD